MCVTWSLHLCLFPRLRASVLRGLGWQLLTFPIIIGAFFLGQFSGAKLRGALAGRGRQ